MGGGDNKNLDEDASVLVEARQLLQDIEDVARDGRLLGRRLSDVISSVINEQCGAIEERMRGLRARLDTLGETDSAPPKH